MKALFCLLILAMSFLCACFSTEPINYPLPPNTDPGLVRPGPAPVPIPPSDKVVILSEAMDALRLRFEKPAGKEAEYAGLLLDYLASRIATGNVRVVQDDREDIRMQLAPAFEVVDVLGEYYRMKCRLNVKLVAAANGQLLAGKVLDLESKKRVLGENNAKEQFLGELSPELAKWTLDSLQAIGEKELCATVIRFALADSRTPLNRNQLAQRVLKVGEAVGAVKGIVSHQLVEQDYVQGICSYRIVYFRHSFPGGVMNTVGQAVASLQLDK